MLQKADIVGKFSRALGDSRQHVEHLAVQLSGIGLAGNSKAGLIAHFFRDQLIQPAAFAMVTLKQLQKAGLGACGSLRAQQLRLGKLVFHVFQIHQKILNPQAGPLSYRGRLCRLKMGKRQRRQVFILSGKLGQSADDSHQLFLHQP